MDRVKLYSGVPGIRWLVFFVYDPDKKLDDIDNLKHDLSGPQHRQDRSGDFEVEVVGPGLPLPHATASVESGSSPSPSLVVDDVRALYDTLGLLVGATVTVPEGRRIDNIHLRVGSTETAPTPPPDGIVESVASQIFPVGGVVGPRTLDIILHYGPGGDGQGQPVKYGSSGLLELRSAATVVAREPIDLPEPKREAVSDADAKNMLASWFHGLGVDQQRAVVSFTETDTRLCLPNGTSKRLLASAIADRFDVKSMGDDTVLFKETAGARHGLSRPRLIGCRAACATSRSLQHRCLSPRSIPIVTAASMLIPFLIVEKRSETFLQSSPRWGGPIGNASEGVFAM